MDLKKKLQLGLAATVAATWIANADCIDNYATKKVEKGLVKTRSYELAWKFTKLLCRNLSAESKNKIYTILGSKNPETQSEEIAEEVVGIVEDSENEVEKYIPKKKKKKIFYGF